MINMPNFQRNVPLHRRGIDFLQEQVHENCLIPSLQPTHYGGGVPLSIMIYHTLRINPVYKMPTQAVQSSPLGIIQLSTNSTLMTRNSRIIFVTRYLVLITWEPRSPSFIKVNFNSSMSRICRGGSRIVI